jgi:hypothetical protein
MASEDIFKQIRCLIAPTIDEMQEAVRSVIADIYAKQISMFWNGHPDPPDFNLIVALEVSGEYVLLLTSQTSVREVKTCDFCGTGENLAAYLAGMFLLDPQGGRVTIPTASAIHIIKEIFRAAKSSTIYVGGSTEIVATRSSKDAQPFFHFQNEGTKEHQDYLWGLQAKLATAIRWALARRPFTSEGVRINFGEAVRDLESAMENLCSNASQADTGPPEQLWMHIKYFPSGEILQISGE